MRKKLIIFASVFLLVFAGLLPASVAVAPSPARAATVSKYIRVSKNTAKKYIPSNAIKIKKGKYYVNTKKLEQIAKDVAKRGNLRSVSYVFKGSKTKQTYTLTADWPSGTAEGVSNGKGWTKTYMQNGTEWRYFSKSTGRMFKGLKKIGSKYYYFYKENGFMASKDRVKIGGRWHYFGEDGARYQILDY